MLRMGPRQLKRAMRAVRRIVTWVSALALLSYALTAGPVMLRMAAAHAGPQTEQTAAAPCPRHADHAQHPNPSSQSPFGDHEHCLFCQGGIGPAVDAALALWVAPSFEAPPFTMVTDSPSEIRHFEPGYTSRAPPHVV
jgi:hypothetical protein